MPDLPFRQIHLDFHTSPHIPDVGKDFDPEEFVETLAEASVNSVTVFAKCHHGYSYYETRAGTKHPALRRDLLADMIEACHRRGIRVPVYYSVMWDELAADLHPEWVLRREDGTASRPPMQPGWRTLCVNSEYTDYVAAATEEIAADYEADGLFFDIVTLTPCYCSRCLAALTKAGRDPANASDQLEFRLEVVRSMMERLNSIVQAKRPGASIYYNGIHPFQWRLFTDRMTHFEIECLPRGGWGYDFFPLAVRRASVLGKPMLGMTGRFLETWGHFGSLSPQASLEYECFSALSHGTTCSIGDQLHPRGKLDTDVYALIGNVYAQVAEREQWCADSVPVCEVAILSPNDGTRYPPNFPEGDLGAMKAFTQCHYQFSVIDRFCSFESYPVLVIPDSLPCDAELARKIQEFVNQGGKLLVTHRGGLNPDGTRFALACLPVEYKGDAPHSPDYLLPRGPWAEGLPGMPLVAYERGCEVAPKPGSEVLASVADSYFDRTWEHFCSHHHTPVEKETDRPGIVAGESAIYFAHPLFTSYYRHGYLAYRDMLTRCLDRLLGRRLVESDLPHSARVTLTQQDSRWILHVLHYVPERRTPRFEVVEDVVPLFERTFSVRTGKEPSRAYLAPQRIDLAFSFSDGQTQFSIPEIRGHQMAVFEF